MADCVTNAYVVDDDPGVARGLGFLLESLGIHPLLFNSGSEFLSRVGSLDPACIFLDKRMPGMDGSEVARELKRRDIDWPLVFMSGDWTSAINFTGEFEPVALLSKPFHEEELMAALDACGRKLRELPKDRYDHAPPPQVRNDRKQSFECISTILRDTFGAPSGDEGLWASFRADLMHELDRLH